MPEGEAGSPSLYAAREAVFGVIIAANLAMLFAATGTFPGLVVKNSYAASQGWDRKTDAQRELGLIGLVAFLWALKNNQYDDLKGDQARILFDEKDQPDE